MMQYRRLSSIDRLDSAVKNMNRMIARERFFMRIDKFIQTILTILDRLRLSKKA